jgi:hypothetical protein
MLDFSKLIFQKSSTDQGEKSIMNYCLLLGVDKENVFIYKIIVSVSNGLNVSTTPITAI